MIRATSTGHAPSEAAADPALSARLAGLEYSTDSEPGLRRVVRGKGFKYLGPDGREIRDLAALERVHALRIPPAWKDVWISPSPRGHLQATGRDDRGRKQYRYHDLWTATREALKYERIINFARALPRIRRRIARDLKLPGLPREKVLAAMVRLMDRTYIRIGNEEYTRAYGSYGLSTLLDRHAGVRGPHIYFHFKGKSGVRREILLTDERLAKIVRRCQELPGQELFQFVNGDGVVRDVNSRDVNDYLREISGSDLTAKDFRTWAGTTLAVECLRGCLEFKSPTAAKRNVAAALDCVAHQLGNTRAVCRKSYVHPGVVEAYLQGDLGSYKPASHPLRGLSAKEAECLKLLERLAKLSTPSAVRQAAKATTRRHGGARSRSRRARQPA